MHQRAVAWLSRSARALRDFVRHVIHSARAHASHCAAAVWLAGIGVFSAATGHRVLAMPSAPEDAPAARIAHHEEMQEVVAMLDVDQINGIRDQRMHANGLAAAGEDHAPDQKTIDAARASRARGIEIDGEKVATAGGVVVVTRGGIAGWVARNRGKKADPETLAWLRGQEAADGTAAYAGWADREDGNILNWALEKRAAARRGSGASAGSADAGSGSAPTLAAIDAAAAGTSEAAHAGSAATGAAGSAAAPVNPTSAATAAAVSATAITPANSACAVGTGSETAATSAADSTASAANAGSAAPVPSCGRPGGVAIQGLELAAIGAAAARALAPHPVADPTEAELAALRDQIQTAAPSGTMKLTVRDHRAVVMLLCDTLFDRTQPELTFEGTRGVRGLGRLLAADRDHAFRVVVDRARALELVANLAIAGLPAERIELAFKDVDRAIDTAEIEYIDMRSP